ncbi:MAG TPA: Spy/CpxP family protein refolding chaperone [Burkholderiales bacterium]|nr:Spy/CpxP family protein refolding chaperone [Burkholderiales bacterium]
MVKTHNTRIGTLLLAAVFAAALWPVAAGAQEQAAPQDKPQAQAPARLRDRARELFNITPEQEKQIREFREARLKERQAFRGQMTKMRIELGSLMKDPKANAAAINDLIDGMSRLRAERMKAAIRTRGEFEKIFTPEQLEKMKTQRRALVGRLGFFGPRMGRFMGPMGGWGMRPGFRAGFGWGWRMRAAAWRWRHPFFWFGW